MFLAVLQAGCAEPEIDFELPDEPTELRVPLASPPNLRSPLGTSARVSSHVSNSSGGRLVDHACRRISRRGHRGTDFAVPVGTPVYAAIAGEVIRRADGCAVGQTRCGGGFGNHVILLHADARATLYAHLRSGSGIPRVGDRVGCGDPIGASGNTGRSTGPHLHFEVRDGVTSADTYFGRPARDPWGGACSTQTAALWADTTPGPSCDGASAPPRDGSSFVSATHPKRARAAAGQTVVQRWTLRNSGTTTWSRTEGYTLAHVGGPDFGQATPIELPVSEVRPGSRATFELHAVAPPDSGIHRGEWRMARGTDGLFGEVVYLELQTVMPAARASCRSATLGRDVPDGSCVQVSYPGCGAASCSWYACRDGAFTCTDSAACAGATHPHASCGAACDARPDCGACATEPGCAWCGDRCVAESARACSSPITEPAGCAACATEGAACEADEDCCGADDGGSMRCFLDVCTDVLGCGLVGAGCAVREDCCGQIVCRADPTGSNVCCLRDTDPCTSDAECCGETLCTDGRCACRGAGEPCANLTDCCGAMLCTDGVCGF